jgi:DNA (cytosine-5)-methyltransferase 1
MKEPEKTFNYASLCDGIGAVHVAWQPLGWRCAWTSEIEPFPAAVVAARHGGPVNLGDMTRITKEMMDAHGRLDLVCGGTPCQSFSLAGLRAGLADPRGNLALEFLRLVDLARPHWVLWENVPGVLSVDRGRAFGSFLGALGQLGYGFAWRVLDAQYVRVDGYERSVPQRRRRVFVVGYFGDWRPAAAVLFDRESLFGHSAPRREAGAGVARSITASTGGASGKEQQHTFVGGTGEPLNELVVGALTAGYGRGAEKHPERVGRDGGLIPVAGTLPADYGKQGGGGFAVRRLTPRECERLMGFPDDYTRIDFNGKPAADSPRYRALGNSMCVNVMRWLGRRIEMVEESRQCALHPEINAVNRCHAESMRHK